jgi:hypothetical protein
LLSDEEYDGEEVAVVDDLEKYFSESEDEEDEEHEEVVEGVDAEDFDPFVVSDKVLKPWAFLYLENE